MTSTVRGGPIKAKQLTLTNDHTRFVYQPHRQPEPQAQRLRHADFILKYLQHLPVPGKHMVRYYGLYATGSIRRLNQARLLFSQAAVIEPEPISADDYIERITGSQPETHCPHCGARYQVIAIGPQRPP